MPLDPRIILQGRGVELPDPLQQYGNVLAIKGAQQGQAINALKMQQAQAADARDEASRNALRKFYGGGSKADALPGLAQESPEAYAAEVERQAKLEKEQAGTRKDQASTVESETKTKAVQLAQFAQSLRGVRDQPGYERAIQFAEQIWGPEAMAQVPRQYDPQFVAMAMNATVSEAQRLANSIAQGNLDARNREQSYREQSGTVLNTTDGAMVVNPRTGVATPVKGPQGAPVRQAATSAGGTATEDERKAAAWYAQMGYAKKNMDAVLTETEGAAARPGISEVAARIIPGELGQDLQNAARDPARQRFVQAAESFAEAALRAATGAGINESEARQKIRELTPGWSDSPELRKQKADALVVYIDAVRARAGRALAPAGAGGPTREGAPPSSGADSYLQQAMGR